jgi:nucleolin
MPKRPSSHTLLSNEEEAHPSEVTNEDVEETQKKKKKRIRKRRREKNGDAEATPDDGTPKDEDHHPNEEDELSRTIYMEGIPFAATPEQVRDFLTQPLAGDLLPLQVLELRLPQWQDTGRLRGYGHAVLASAAQCQAAIQQRHRRPFSATEQRYITVAPAVAPKSATVPPPTTSPPSATIVLRNVPYDATEETLQQAFGDWQSGAALPVEVRVVRHYAPPHRSKGLAYVEFATIAAAQAWMEAQPHPPLNGRTLLWDYDQGRMKASFRDAERRHVNPSKKGTPR